MMQDQDGNAEQDQGMLEQDQARWDCFYFHSMHASFDNARCDISIILALRHVSKVVGGMFFELFGDML